MKLLVSLVRPALAIAVLLPATSTARSDALCTQLQGQLAAARQRLVDANAIIENPQTGYRPDDLPDSPYRYEHFVRERVALAEEAVSEAVRQMDGIRREMDIENCVSKLRPARARPAPVPAPPVPILPVPRRPPQQTAAPSDNLPPLPSPPGSERAEPPPREGLPPLPPPAQTVAVPERSPPPPPVVADLPPLPPAPGAQSEPPASTPVIRAPVVRAPPIESPQVRAPPVQVPVVRAPPVEIPQVRAPPVSAPVIRAPTIRAPQIEAPNIRGPRVGTPNRRPAPALTPDRPPPNTRVVARPRHPTKGGGRVAPRSTATVIRVQPRVHRPPMTRAAPQARPRMPAQPVWTRVQGQRRR